MSLLEFCPKCGKLVVHPHTCTKPKPQRTFKHGPEIRKLWRNAKRKQRERKKLQEVKQQIHNKKKECKVSIEKKCPLKCADESCLAYE